MKFIAMGALLLAAPVFSQTGPAVHESRLESFSLEESPAELRKALGSPRSIAEFGADFISWQFQIDQEDTHEFSHQAVIRKDTGVLVSIARTWETERSVVGLFPQQETRIVRLSGYPIAVRTQPGGKLLLGMGMDSRQAPTTQVVLIRKEDLRYFYPELGRALEP